MSYIHLTRVLKKLDTGHRKHPPPRRGGGQWATVQNWQLTIRWVSFRSYQAILIIKGVALVSIYPALHRKILQPEIRIINTANQTQMAYLEVSNLLIFKFGKEVLSNICIIWAVMSWKPNSFKIMYPLYFIICYDNQIHLELYGINLQYWINTPSITFSQSILPTVWLFHVAWGPVSVRTMMLSKGIISQFPSML